MPANKDHEIGLAPAPKDAAYARFSKRSFSLNTNNSCTTEFEIQQVAELSGNFERFSTVSVWPSHSEFSNSILPLKLIISIIRRYGIDSTAVKQNRALFAFTFK